MSNTKNENKATKAQQKIIDDLESDELSRDTESMVYPDEQLNDEQSYEKDNQNEIDILYNKIKAHKTQLPNTDQKKTKLTNFGSWFSWRTYADWYKYYTQQSDILVINMQKRNGFNDSFYIYPTGTSFVYDNATYILDDSFKYWHIGFSSYTLDYHQNFAIPINKQVDGVKLLEAIEASGQVNVIQGINPTNLENFIKSAMIEKVMKGEELDSMFIFLKRMTILNAVLTLGVLGLLAKTLGWI